MSVSELTDLPKRLQAIYDTRIDPEEIIFLVQEMENLHDEGMETSWYTSLAILADRYKEDHNRVVCISERMMCLTEVMEDDRMRAWARKPAGKEYTLTNQAAFIATAKCPLRFKDEKLFFDPEEFFQLALIESPAEGSA